VRILGISAFYHDSAAAAVVDGRIVAAAQEERFTRKKHDSNFPTHAIEYCLREAGSGLDAFDFVAFYDKPFLKFERLLETYLAFAPRGFRSFRMAIPVWIKEKLFQKRLITQELRDYDGDYDWESRLLFAEHHQSHAASAFYPSPFENAVVLTMDGVGEWATTSVGLGSGNSLEMTKEIHFPHSLGLLYSAFTYYTGFKVNSGEYKVMGLAPYGEPKYKDLVLEHLMDLKEDGTFRLDMSYFDYCTGLRMTNEKFDELFGGPPRKAEDRVTQREMDLAASVQAVTEEVVLRLTRTLAKESETKNLCLAGGVALNCVANGKVLRDGVCDNIWVQPAAGDAGGALGAALFVWHQLLEKPRVPQKNDAQQGSLLGPAYSNAEMRAFLDAEGAVYTCYETEEAAVDAIAGLLADEEVVGHVSGRMEFGPRALGNRSILGTPLSTEMQTRMNLMIKFRESFRPFAPSVLREDVQEYFELDYDSPYMLIVAGVHPDKRKQVNNESEGLDKLQQVRSEIPAITHVDYSARIQTVDNKGNPLYHRLISAFKAKTGCPVIVNTSFNVRGEPIVRTPEDAYRCFTRTHMDVLVLGPYVIERDRQTLPPVDESWKSEFELD